MSIRFFSKWLLFTVVLGLLSACGGGDEPSNLLTGTGGNVGGSPTSVSDDGMDVTYSLTTAFTSQASAIVTLITYERFDPQDTNSQRIMEPHVTFVATLLSGAAKLENVPGKTNHEGKASFTVTHDGLKGGNVSINISFTGRWKGGSDFSIAFGASVIAKVITEGTVPANGTTPINVKVFLRDVYGEAIPGVPVTLSFPPDSFATPVPTGALGDFTDINGEFSANITNTVPQETYVTPYAYGIAANSGIPLPLSFGLTGGGVVPETIDLLVKSDNVQADGVTPATLMVIVRDAAGTPVPNMPVSLFTDSLTAQLKVADKEETATFSIIGDTGPNAYFELDIANTIQEEVKITATTTTGDETKTQTQTVNFTDDITQTGIEIASIVLDKLINNPSEPKANGTDSVTLMGRVLDIEGNGVADQKIRVLVSGGSANFVIANSGKTDADGFFIVKFTDRQVEEFTARVVVGKISSKSDETIRFTAVESTTANTIANSVTLLATPEKKLFEESGSNEITLTIIVRDNNFAPMSGVPVIMDASSDTATFDKTFVETSAGGTANVKVSNTVPGSFEVIAKVPLAEGRSISSKKTIEFTPVGATTEGDVTVGFVTVLATPEKKLFEESGANEITLTIIVRDKNFNPLPGISVIMATTSNTATFDKTLFETGSDGSGLVKVSNTVPGAFDVIAKVALTQNETVEAQKTVEFTLIDMGGDEVTISTDIGLDVHVVNSPQPANGEAPIRIDLVAKNRNTGLPVGGLPLVVRMSTGIAAKADPPKSETGEDGFFTTNITSTQSGDITVIIAVEGTTLSESRTIRFEAASDPPVDVQLEVLNPSQPADGKSKITLIAKPINTKGTPVRGVTIQFIHGSDNVVIKEKEGTTDLLGQYRAFATSSVPESFQVTPVAVKDALVIEGRPVLLEFTPVTDSRSFDFQVINNNQPADGLSPITLVVTFRNANNEPVVGANVKFIAESENLKFKDDSKEGTINEVGEFRTTVTNETPETVKVVPVINIEDGTGKPQFIAGIPKFITFEQKEIGVGSLTVTVVGNNQPANSDSLIKVSVVARKKNGEVAPDVPILVTMPPTAAKVILPASKVTDVNGVFEFEITSSVPEKNIAVNVSVEGTDIAHPPVFVTFTVTPDGGSPPTRVEVQPTSLTLQASAETPVTLIVVPRDAANNAVPGLTVKLIPNQVGVLELTPNEGETNEIGEFHTSIKVDEKYGGTLPLSVNLTPIVKDKEGKTLLTGGVIPVLFDVPIPTNLTLTVDSNPEIGKDVILTILARDEKNFPMKNVPVKILVEGAISGSVIFSDTGFQGLTNDQGVFTTSIKSSQAGTVTVTAMMLGEDGEPILNSKSAEIPFKSPDGEAIKTISELRLITSSTTLLSEGKSSGVIITAIIKDENNNLVEGAEVNFSADSGEIALIEVGSTPVVTEETGTGGEAGTGGGTTTQPTTPTVSGSNTTDVSGRVQARLTTQTNSDNRTITVTATVSATVPPTTGEPKTDSIDIEVIGTTIDVPAAMSVAQGAVKNFTISLRDSNSKAVPSQTLSVKSKLGNLFNDEGSEITVQTDVKGQADITFLASIAGEDIVRVSKPGVPKVKERVIVVAISDDNFNVTPVPLPPPLSLPENQRCLLMKDKDGEDKVSENEDINNNRLLDLGEDVNGDNKLDLGCRMPLHLTEGRKFKVEWKAGEAGQGGETLIVSTTRGRVDNTNITTDDKGVAIFTVFPGGDAGDAIVTVHTQKQGGPSESFNIKFMATEASSITVQAFPAVIGVNPEGESTERSEISAVVRNSANNLVFDQEVHFRLEDITGGRLTEDVERTDDFGRVTTEYVAGPSSSAANGITVTATVADVPTVSSFTNLTVAAKDLFVVIGSGNELVKDEGRRYKVFHSILVTDSNGTPVNDAEVILSIYPLEYLARDFSVCLNEDINRNGLLDPDEDTNNNGRLDPGNVITVDNLTLVTGTQEEGGTPGFADFDVIYAIQYAQWLTAEITARTKVAGSEDSSVIRFTTACEATDALSRQCPLINPFEGGGKNCVPCPTSPPYPALCPLPEEEPAKEEEEPAK
ncbi:Ig-like domain-containing protein [Candidatus Parabeggiatoa sp. HSG14]|uniref:Ig-like domain-containing protein n=1 Tax=Candidatus Parabeggiatoa sp. HSG14 TaxID=3055593 RepID=UPI0025A8E957|nr:Ig-like domain-containing protein [Thiotrichales bacterium HSG14]